MGQGEKLTIRDHIALRRELSRIRARLFNRPVPVAQALADQPLYGVPLGEHVTLPSGFECERAPLRGESRVYVRATAEGDGVEFIVQDGEGKLSPPVAVRGVTLLKLNELTAKAVRMEGLKG